MAQSLARKQIRIGVLIPDYWPQFHKHLERGIHMELDLLSDFNVSGIFEHIHSEKSQEEIKEMFNNLISKEIDAIILCPGFNYNYEDALKQIEDRGIPTLLLGNDLTYGKRITFVGVDSELSGRMAAEYARYLIRKNGSVAVFIGNKDIESHKKKADGFMQETKRNPFRIADVYETRDDPELAYFLTEKLVNDFPDIEVIYVATGNSSAVCKYINENDLKIKVIGTDVFMELINYMNMDIVASTIFQDPLSQGNTAIKTIYSYLTEQKKPPDKIFISPQMILKSNIKLYL